jgi:hypothetical protein
MIKMIPQEDTAVANGTVLSISLSDGKVTQNLFSFMKICTNIFLQCTEEGFQFIGILVNKQSKMQEAMSDQRRDMVFYLNFKKDKVPEYFFCPNNLNIEVPGGKNSLTFMLSMSQITTLLKKTKMKATTILRFDLNGRTNTFAMYIVNGVSVIPYTLQVQLSETVKDVVPAHISDMKLSPNYKFSVELFYTMIIAAAAKSDNVPYDFRIAIHKGGVAIQSDAPGIGAIPYGTMRDNPHVFNLSHDATKYFGLIHKITPRATVLLTAVDETVFKVSFPIGSCGEGFIFQFPKHNATVMNYQQPAPQISWNNQSQITNANWSTNGVAQPISAGNVPWQQPSVTPSNINNLTPVWSQPVANGVQNQWQTQPATQDTVSMAAQWQAPAAQGQLMWNNVPTVPVVTASPWSVSSAFEASQYNNTYPLPGK